MSVALKNNINYVIGISVGNREKKILQAISRLQPVTMIDICKYISNSIDIREQQYMAQSMAHLLKKGLVSKQGKYKGARFTLSENYNNLVTRAIEYS